MLRYLARRIHRQPVRLLLALTYRESELGEARSLNDLLAALQRERLAERLKLSRLSREQTSRLLSELFAEAITPEFLDSIYRETEGNPFFVEEVCKTLVETGQLYRAGGEWRRPAMSEIQVPQNIRIAIEARLEKLPENTQSLLRLAAVIGREFDFETLRAVSDLSEDLILEALENAERSQIIAEVQRQGKSPAGSNKFTFAHALIPSTLREGLSSLRLQRLHQRVGQEIERLNPDRLDEFCPQLGRHFSAAGDWAKAAHYLLKAGARAQAAFATAEAAGYFQQALAILKDLGSENVKDAARTAMKLGQLYHTIFEFQSSRQAFQEAFALWQRASEIGLERSLPPAPHALRLHTWAGNPLQEPALAPTNDMTLINHLLCGLVELTPELDITPNLAQRWEISQDGRHYIFSLRRDARWSDGEPITAGDFEYFWKRAIHPASCDDYAQFFFDIQGARAYHQGQLQDVSQVGVRALDPHTLAVDLEEPVGHFLYLLAFAITFPAPRHIVESVGSAWIDPQHIACSGPFCLESFEPDGSMTLARNPAYCGSRSGNLEHIQFTCLGEFDPDLLLEQYAAGNLDCIPIPVLPEIIERCRKIHASDYAQQPLAGTTYLVFDSSRPPFDDDRVRRAFGHALDIQTFIDLFLRGPALPGSGGFIPPGIPGHTPSIGFSYNPGEARRLLAEAGYPGGHGFPEVEYAAQWPVSTPHPGDQFLSAQWRDNLGVSVQLKLETRAEFDRRINTDMPHIARTRWLADYLDPDSFLRVALNCYQNIWFDPEYHKLLETARRIQDQSERLKFYQAADRRLVESARVIPLFYEQALMLIRPWVKQYPTTPLAIKYWKDVILEAH